jgi:hypothetical protein
MVNMAMCNGSFFWQDIFTPVMNTLHGTQGAMSVLCGCHYSVILKCKCLLC